MTNARKRTTPGPAMESDLSLEFLRVVEQAAIACAHTMGQGDRHGSDQAAVEAMRQELDTVPIDGTIVIGEGERDEAPMLFIGEKVGLAGKGNGDRRAYDKVDIAVDPLEGTNLCATGTPNAIAVLAASEEGGLLHAPDLYMEKLVVGPSSKHLVDLDAPVRENLRAIARSARAAGRRADGRGARPAAPREADRRHPRHRRAHPADRRRRSVGRHRRGGVGQRRPRGDGHRRRARGRADRGRHAVPQRRDLRPAGHRQARGRRALPRRWASPTPIGSTPRRTSPAARTSSSPPPASPTAALLRGVRFFGDGIRTSSIVMQTNPHRIRFIDSIQVYAGPGGEDPLLTTCRRVHSMPSEPGAVSPPAAEFSPRRNVLAAAAANGIGFAGFTLVMPFLPLYIHELGVTDVADIAMWTGLTLGATPAVTAVSAPLWGRVGDRYGSKVLVIRSLAAFVLTKAAMAFVTAPWQLFALRALLGVFAGYGALTVSMAAESVPREQMAAAIGVVQMGQRLGPAVGPVIGGLLAPLVGMRRAFLVAALFYLAAVVMIAVFYKEPRTRQARAAARSLRDGRPGAGRHARLLAGVRRDLRLADRRPQLRADPAALCRTAGVPPGRGAVRRRHPVLARRRSSPPSAIAWPARSWPLDAAHAHHRRRRCWPPPASP